MRRTTPSTLSVPGMTYREVKVVPHDPAWAEAFRKEAATLRSVFGDEAVAIRHIGSTSVPGLAAKPTVDVLVEVRRIWAVDALNDAMVASGHQARGEYGIPGRRYFTRNSGAARTHNVHVFETDSPEARRHLAFRDYLRQHPETARAYGDLKKELARRHPTDIESYMDGKDAFVKSVEKEAISWSRTAEGQAEMPKARAAGPKRADRLTS